MNIYDYVVLGLFAALIIWGNISGLILSCYRLVSTLISCFIAINLFPYVSACLRLTPLFGYLTKLFSDKFFETLSDSFKKNAEISLDKAFSTLKFPRFIEDWLETSTDSILPTETLRNISNSIGLAFSKLLIDVIAIILLFFLILLIMFILKKVLKTIVRLPVIRTADRLLGTIFGFVLAFVIAYLLTGIIYILAGMLDWNEITRTINQSFFKVVFCNNNYIITSFH